MLAASGCANAVTAANPVLTTARAGGARRRALARRAPRARPGGAASTLLGAAREGIGSRWASFVRRRAPPFFFSAFLIGRARRGPPLPVLPISVAGLAAVLPRPA